VRHRDAEGDIVPTSETERNAAVFNRPDVVADYRGATGLTAAEAHLFGEFVSPGSDVLDLGVGTGRTTPALSAKARRYVGLDCAEAMVLAGREEHPGIDFRVGDAGDLADFDDDAFDVVVFSFNGLDYLHPVADRRRCLDECRRVLRPHGVLIVSTHHSRMLLPPLPARGGPRRARRFAHWLRLSMSMVWRRASSATFWRGHGYVLDPVRGGLTTFETTPSAFAAEVRGSGFTVVTTVASSYPAMQPRVFVPWFYFCCRADASAQHS
jgi:SAM-dependent methyltransferase